MDYSEKNEPILVRTPEREDDLERSVHYGMSEHIQTMEKDLSRTNLNTLGNDSVNYDAITV